MLTWSTIQSIWNILGFPGGIGCIACTQIPRIAPSINGDWVNRSVHSINVQMSLNSTFTYILHNTATASNYVYQLWISHICNAVLHHCQRGSEVAWVCTWLANILLVCAEWQICQWWAYTECIYRLWSICSLIQLQLKYLTESCIVTEECDGLLLGDRGYPC